MGKRRAVRCSKGRDCGEDVRGGEPRSEEEDGREWRREAAVTLRWQIAAGTEIKWCWRVVSRGGAGVGAQATVNGAGTDRDQRDSGRDGGGGTFGEDVWDDGNTVMVVVDRDYGASPERRAKVVVAVSFRMKSTVGVVYFCYFLV
ncbi:serine acetyltransferase [Sesbania bispinosa]|nr:serine acetyltransferase [Sesbania bispinosa]